MSAGPCLKRPRRRGLRLGKRICGVVDRDLELGAEPLQVGAEHRGGCACLHCARAHWVLNS
ncbi:hypothetical protein ACFPRL_19445 [Pseudoclavibacter helvolus]